MVCVIEFTFVTEIKVKNYTNNKRMLLHKIKQIIKNKRKLDKHEYENNEVIYKII